MTRVTIDLNVRLSRTQTFSRLSHADGPLSVGEEVTVVEAETGISGPATVSRIDTDRGFVFLDLDWSQLRFDYEPPRLELPVMSRSPADSPTTFGRSVHLAGGAYYSTRELSEVELDHPQPAKDFLAVVSA